MRITGTPSPAPAQDEISRFAAVPSTAAALLLLGAVQVERV